MVFSPLHRALGVPASPFTFDMLDAAISQAIEEDDDLDWKRHVHHREQSQEFAKDVAAMSNTNGGLIVFGIDEVAGPTTAAGAIEGVSGWGDAEERRLRSIAYSHIQPPVHGLRFETVTRDSTTVVLLTIPPSPDAPHLVWHQDKFSAPIRYGAKTEYMRERDIERAYRRRFAAREETDALLNLRLDRIEQQISTTGRVWQIGAAAPIQRRRATERVSLAEAKEILTDLHALQPWSRTHTNTRININPRTGLRSWRSVGTDHEHKIQTVIEIHDDGSVAMADTDLSDRHRTHQLHPLHVQGFAADLLWLAQSAATRLHVGSDYVARATFRSTVTKPLQILRWDRYGQEEAAEPIGQFYSVDVTYDPIASDQTKLETVRGFVTDIINQGGQADIGDTYIRTHIDQPPAR